ncbi:MAG TPA: GntR family transcriptional regulator [Candidatus Binatia bacterium]|nr:GntR family transcriptional regulator [Candidatus Binatia bacterium]
MTTLAHKQLWEAVSDRLRDDILDGRLAAGTRLVETELADRFGVSRGPIRDALRELSRTGLAVDVPRRGTFVSSLTERDLDEVYVIRRAIEESAVRLTIERADDAGITEMFRALDAAEAAYAGDDLAAAWDADMAFHRSYCRLSGNGRLLALFENLASQTVLLMRTTLDSHASLAWTPPVEVHRRIANAIAARDPDAATLAVGAHYQYTQDRLHASDTPDGRATSGAPAASDASDAPPASSGEGISAG